MSGVIYASPLARARDTAAPVARSRDLEIRLDEDLLEFDSGDVAGSVRADVKVRLRRDHLTTSTGTVRATGRWNSTPARSWRPLCLASQHPELSSDTAAAAAALLAAADDLLETS
ncbi:MAG: histidine phosphatase family protein [Geodermatophilaceae bacterium]|nr:histidine phosphatase family protein [Geodermatophilaceae bacterium]